MFSNKQQEKLESFIGRNTHFKGDIITKGTLRVDGQVTGNIETDWLVMGSKSLLKGNTKAGGVVVGGTIEGNIIAKEIVEIKNKGQIIGDVTTTKLVVVEGGFIDGKITMNKDAAASSANSNNVVEFQSEKVKDSHQG